MRIHFVIHEVFEAPGFYLTWAQKNNHDISLTRVHMEENLPNSADDFDMLIVMGGPQSPEEDKLNYPYYHPQEEMALMRQFVKQNKAIIGVCLGAQLLGQALGADVERSPEKEIGNFPIKLTDAGLADENFFSFASPLTVGHWHGDMPGLTKNSQILATSQGCPRQIIKYGDKQYGFQCHLEFSKELVAMLLDQEKDFDKTLANHPFVQSATEIQHYDYSEMNRALESFLDSFSSVM